MTPVTAEELRSMRDRNPDLVLINTLPQEHFAKTKIAGAVNIPGDRGDFTRRVEQKAGGKDGAIVVYCASAECDSSAKAAQKLEEAGFENVFDFEGGFEAWQQEEETAPAHAAVAAR